MVNGTFTWLDTVKSRLENLRGNRSILYSLLGLVFLIVVAGTAYYSIVYKTEISEFDLTASASDVAGVAPSSHFTLKTTVALSPQVLEKYMKVSPETPFSIKKVADLENTFEIIPEVELQSEQIYTITLDKGPLASHDFSWAYQIKAPFQLTSSMPGDKAIDVPLKTGIELYFNRENIVKPEDLIEISPVTRGRFETSGNKVLFIPSTPLDPRIIYTVTIKRGLEAKDSTDVLTEDVVIKFQTASSWSNVQGINFSQQFNEFKPGEPVFMGVGVSGDNQKPIVDVAVYKFSSADDFIDSVKKTKGDNPWARYSVSQETKLPDANKMFTGSIPIEARGYLESLRLPQTFETGYYAVEVSLNKEKDISWFQVNPVASFVAFSGAESLVWLKDIATGKSITDTPILFEGKQVGKTGGDGVSLFETPQVLLRQSQYFYSANNDDHAFLRAKLPAGDLVIPAESQYGSSASVLKPDAWWNYISLNKNTYLSTDIVRFWVIQKPRGGGHIDEEVTVKLSQPTWDDEKDAVTYGETKVKVSEYDAITGEVSFSNLQPGIYELTFYNGEVLLGKKTVTVSTYIKPAYRITVSPDRNTVFAGSPVTFDVKAEFFDKTPVTNTVLSYTAYMGYIEQKNPEGNITLDAEGRGTFTITPPYSSSESYWPAYVSVNVRPEKAEEGDISTNATVFVFGPHINNSIEQKQTNTDITFSVKTREVILGDTSRTEPYWDREEYLGGPVQGVSTKVDIVEVVYLRNQTGTDYDPINKITTPVYDYKTEERPISSEALVSDQNGLSTLSFSPGMKKTYKFTFTASDREGRIEKTVHYVYGYWGTDGSDSSVDEQYSLYNPDRYKNYKVGDVVNLQLQTYQGLLAPEGRDYIFMSVNNGDIDYKVQSSPKYTTTFQTKDIPNIGIWPGWFSQGRFHNSYVQNISFDADERRLNITVTKNKETYKPGDTVSLDIKVTDKDNNPMKAEINLSALDEAVFSMQPYEEDLVNGLYRDLYSEMVIRTSNTPPYGGGGAEKGGGGDDAPRSNIQEMAIYKSVTSDANGNAHVEFKIPDNVTSWRLTSQAVTKDLFVGKDITFIPVSLPFFVEATLNTTYLAGDLLTLRLRTFGSAMTEGITKYSLQSKTLPFAKLEKTGGSNLDIPLGALPSGTHELTVRATNGTLTDAIVRPLEVRNSYFTKDTSDLYDGVAGLTISNDSTRYTTLTFSEYGKGSLYGQLRYLGCQCGVRLDQLGSERVASRLLTQYFNDKDKVRNIDLTKYQSYNGGLRLLPYASEDLELSAISAHLFTDSEVDVRALTNYLNHALTDKQADVSRSARALYGLTAFREPVLTKLQNLKNAKGLTLSDQVFIALALDTIGAKEEARSYYKKMIKPSVTFKPSYAYIDDMKGDEAITMTALVAALTASLEEPESDLLATYVSQNQPKETLNNFQRLLYLQARLPKLDDAEVSFTYKVGTKEENQVLKDGGTFTKILSPEELKSFKMVKSKGRVAVVASYDKPSSPDQVVQDSNLSITRSYEARGNVTKEFKEGDIIKIRLIPQFKPASLDGVYQVIDHVPSGLRPIENTTLRFNDDRGNRAYMAGVDGQKVTFVIIKEWSVPVYYYARVVSKGTYKAEPAILQSLRSIDSLTVSHEDSIVIK